jgi:A/G-specific adenine glycosylase
MKKTMITNLHISEAVKSKKPFLQRAVIKWATNNLREFPWRKERTPYRILVAEILLRRTTSSAVLRIYEKFLVSHPKIGDLANANEKELETFLSTIGYQKQRAKILKEIAAFIVREYGGEIPRSAEKLLRIPHVGPYITGAILSFGYDRPAAIVDSNVIRIFKRVFSKSLPGKTSPQIIQDMSSVLVPTRAHDIYNLGLLDLGALVCRYDYPRCPICPLKSICDYQRLNSS